MVAQIDAKYIKTRPKKLITRLISYALFEGRPLTTKGQWINPLVFALFWLEKRLPQMKVVDRPVFITGTGRSGSTILGVVLSIHKDVGFLNEPKALWHSVYPDEDVIGSYSRGKAHYRLGEPEASERVLSAAHKLFGSYLWTVNSRRLVDKYPELIFRIPFVAKIFPDAKYLFLVRNGWDTCNSIEAWSSRLGVQKNGEVHDWWGVNNRKWNLFVEELIRPDLQYAAIEPVLDNIDDHRLMAAIEWVVTMREGLLQMERYPDSIRIVRYEKLVSNPRKELKEIVGFCELSNDEVFLSYGEQLLSPAPSYNQFEMPLEVRILFDETMRMLGYENE